MSDELSARNEEEALTHQVPSESEEPSEPGATVAGCDL